MAALTNPGKGNKDDDAWYLLDDANDFDFDLLICSLSSEVLSRLH